MDKKSLRKNMISTLSSLDKTYKNEKEEILKEKFLEFIKEHDIKSIGIVLAMPHELDTDGIIAWMKEEGREVYTPVCDYKSKEMNFCRFVSFEDIIIDEKNLRVPSSCEDINNQVELIVVPGLIYSEAGYRIGYGGGFYDRFLKDYKGLKASLLFEEQIGEVITEDHDVPVDVLITPDRTIGAKSRRLTDEK
ncbi:5-formyltetrahydrofolate cyclo-ligase [Salinicoccus sp. HZC-1]|uniref:5-formyltetrahydrofolate cyclo-ligase n=1 Tax=Salinicoccus sp. HZC-1 TaxID=3385497 RepID=UPI00398BAF75